MDAVWLLVWFHLIAALVVGCVYAWREARDLGECLAAFAVCMVLWPLVLRELCR